MAVEARRVPDIHSPTIRTQAAPSPALEVLIELKASWGSSAPHHSQDLVDVMELVRTQPAQLADALDPSVRAEFEKQWDLAQEIVDNT